MNFFVIPTQILTLIIPIMADVCAPHSKRILVFSYLRQWTLQETWCFACVTLEMKWWWYAFRFTNSYTNHWILPTLVFNDEYFANDTSFQGYDLQIADCVKVFMISFVLRVLIWSLVIWQTYIEDSVTHIQIKACDGNGYCILCLLFLLLFTIHII